MPPLMLPCHCSFGSERRAPPFLFAHSGRAISLLRRSPERGIARCINGGCGGSVAPLASPCCCFLWLPQSVLSFTPLVMRPEMMAICFNAGPIAATVISRRDPGETQFDDLEWRDLLHAGRARYRYGRTVLHLGL